MCPDPLGSQDKARAPPPQTVNNYAFIRNYSQIGPGGGRIFGGFYALNTIKAVQQETSGFNNAYCLMP